MTILEVFSGEICIIAGVSKPGEKADYFYSNETAQVSCEVIDDDVTNFVLSGGEAGKQSCSFINEITLSENVMATMTFHGKDHKLNILSKDAKANFTIVEGASVVIDSISDFRAIQAISMEKNSELICTETGIAFVGTEAITFMPEHVEVGLALYKNGYSDSYEEYIKTPADQAILASFLSILCAPEKVANILSKLPLPNRVPFDSFVPAPEDIPNNMKVAGENEVKSEVEDGPD